MTRKLPLLLAALVPMLAPAAPRPAAVVDFIRVDEDAAAVRLQTALTRYEKDGVTVDLIGAVHIADPAYYQDLNQRFDGYDALLFEMIGGREEERAAAKQKAAKAKVPAKPTKAAKPPAGKKGDDEVAEPANLDVIHRMYGLVSRFLALTDQMTHIDYTKKNFVHADLSLAEFERLQAERGESVLGFAMEAGRKAEKAGGGLAEPDLQSLMRAVMSGNPNAVKLQIVHTLGQGADQVAAFAGESVIIGDRNAKCVQVLGQQVKGGKHKLGIFYGAAHFPDMEKRLAKLGYRRVKQEWLTAWDIPKAKPAAGDKAGEKEEKKEAVKEAA